MTQGMPTPRELREAQEGRERDERRKNVEEAQLLVHALQLRLVELRYKGKG